MENGIAVKNAGVPGRDIGVITNEIKTLYSQAQAIVTSYAIEIGRRLVEAKDAVGHGEWGRWLKDEVGFSQSTANNYMRLFEEYGDAQITIFGAVANSQTIGNLPYAKALALLAIPSEEREEFAEAVGAEDLSVRELQKAIKERDEERARAKELEERIEELNGARGEAMAAADEVAELQEKVKSIEASLTKEKEKSNKLKEKLDKAKSDPAIPPEKIEEIKKEASEEAKKELSSELSLELEKVREALKAAENAKDRAEKEQRAAEEKLKAAEGKLKTADPDVNAFKVMFEALQEQVNKCTRHVEKIESGNLETAQKLRSALKMVGERLVSFGS